MAILIETWCKHDEFTTLKRIPQVFSNAKVIFNDLTEILIFIILYSQLIITTIEIQITRSKSYVAWCPGPPAVLVSVSVAASAEVLTKNKTKHSFLCKHSLLIKCKTPILMRPSTATLEILFAVHSDPPVTPQEPS